MNGDNIVKIMRLSQSRDSARNVLFALAARAGDPFDAEKKKNHPHPLECWPKVAALMIDTGIRSDKTVRTALQELVRLGEIVEVKAGRGQGMPTHWRIVLPLESPNNNRQILPVKESLTGNQAPALSVICDPLTGNSDTALSVISDPLIGNLRPSPPYSEPEKNQKLEPKDNQNAARLNARARKSPLDFWKEIHRERRGFEPTNLPADAEAKAKAKADAVGAKAYRQMVRHFFSDELKERDPWYRKAQSFAAFDRKSDDILADYHAMIAETAERDAGQASRDGPESTKSPPAPSPRPLSPSEAKRQAGSDAIARYTDRLLSDPQGRGNP